MRGLVAAQTIAQRGTAGLRRPASAIGTSILATRPSSAVQTTRPTSSGFLCTPATASCLAARCFSHTAIQQKKGGKKDKKGGAAAATSTSSSSSNHESSGADDDGGNHPIADPADAFNFADVESRWQRAETHHEEKFKELKRALSSGTAGVLGDGEGGIDVDAVGKTPVVDREADTSHGDNHVPLSQLALVIPRAGGRLVELRMHNPASRKAIISAVQSNPLFHGQQPQPDPNDELVLLLKLGGAGSAAVSGKDSAKGSKGGTSPAAAAIAERTRRVNELANTWRSQIRKATERRHKMHQQWKKDKAVQPDDLHRLERDLLKGQEKRMAKVDASEKEALKQAERISSR